MNFVEDTKAETGEVVYVKPAKGILTSHNTSVYRTKPILFTELCIYR